VTAGNITELTGDEMTLVTEDKKGMQVRNFHLTSSTNYYTQSKEFEVSNPNTTRPTPIAAAKRFRIEPVSKLAPAA
jgi:hypothetical protein